MGHDINIATKKIAEENPNLPLAFIEEILLAKKEVSEGSLSEYPLK